MQEINFDTFKDDIQEMVQQQSFSDDEVVAALARRGFQTSTRSLQRRLASWNIRRERLAGKVSDALAEAVNYLFHHTLLNDAEIATRIINDYGLQTSPRQVRSIRSLFGWRRATYGPARATQQTSTPLVCVPDLSVRIRVQRLFYLLIAIFHYLLRQPYVSNGLRPSTRLYGSQTVTSMVLAPGT
jgi:hypothetical protein